MQCKHLGKYVLFISFFYINSIKAQVFEKQNANDTIRSIEIEDELEVISLPHDVNVDTIPTNPFKYKRNDYEEQKLYRSTKLKVAIFANVVWKMRASTINSKAEFYFKNRDFDTRAFFFTIADTTTSYQQAVNNALLLTRVRDFDAAIVTAEFRYVNANKVLFIEVSERMKRYRLRTLYYVYKNKDGMTQINLSVLKRDLKKLRTYYESFLNGFVITDNEKNKL